MRLHINEISRHVEKGAHAVLVMDRAGWHTTAKLTMPKNITAIFLPSRAPELNPVENVWNTCDRTGSRTASSTPTTSSSMPPAKPGRSSSPNRRPSPQSECGNGLMSVKLQDSLYYGERPMKGRTYRSDIWPHQPADAKRLKESLASGEPSIHGPSRAVIFLYTAGYSRFRQ